MYIYVCICVYVCMYIYVYVYIFRDSQVDNARVRSDALPKFGLIVYTSLNLDNSI